MHYKAEIVIPNVDDVKETISKVLAPFDEGSDDEDASSYRFWDFWVIGGRFAGDKLQTRLDKTKIDQFYKELESMKIMCSGITAGKQEIATKEQRLEVDSLWQNMFPESGISVCPFFKHSNNQYDSSSLLPGDICTYSDVPKQLTAEVVIFAADPYGHGIEAVHMVKKNYWNGVNYQDSDWDGLFIHAVGDFEMKAARYSKEYQEKTLLRDDHLVVTVDYHS